VGEKLENDSLLDDELEIQGHQGNIDEDDVFKDIETEEMEKVQGRN